MTTRPLVRFGRVLACATTLGTLALAAQPARDVLEQGFRDPPAAARPRVWWHWLNGNITKDGITADLEWMKRIGIGGVQNFDAMQATPVIVEKRLAFMTPEWRDAFRHAVTTADRLGLEFAIAASPGWSESGGPWVTPAQAMKKVVWSQTIVEGGRPYKGVLNKPPSVAGVFQNAPGFRTFSQGAAHGAPLEFYRDIAVLAMPAEHRLNIDGPGSRVAVNGNAIDASALFDGDYMTAVTVPAAPADQATRLDIDLGKPGEIRGVCLGVANAGPAVMAIPTTDDGPEVQTSDDGQLYRSVARLPRGRLPQYTVRLIPTRARHVRLLFSKPARETRVTELALHATGPVHRFEDKAGFAPAMDLTSLSEPVAASDDAVARDVVIDLTDRMRSDGSLDWTPPPGLWTVLRLGYSLTGKENAPASAEATGLEVDKMSAAHVWAYFTEYLDRYREASGGLMGARGLQYVVTDSWEAGAANWTDGMIGEFTKRRGYDPRPWLPTLTGRLVQSAAASDKFLWDFRATIAELTVANHYDQLTAILRERGMARYSESHEDRRAFIADGMEVKRSAAIPMSAMWTGRGGPLGVPPQFAADIRESASVAHIYGQNIVAAESLTAAGGAYRFSPESLKATADAELSQGLNRFVIHTSVHQPLSDRRPGLGLGMFGQWFTRHETWADQADAWITYLARSSYMLQQGRSVADVLYYYGEDSNITALFGEKAPDVPLSCNFDYANSDVILNRLAAANGHLTTQTGMTYRVLVLDANARLMQLPVLEKIRALVRSGAVVTGQRPERSPRLLDDESKFNAIVSELWGSDKGVHAVGSGRVYVDTPLADVLSAEEIVPDFEHTTPQPDSALLFVHRALPDGEIYWVNNRQKRAEAFEATFRVAGKAPEIWHPDTGLIEPASYRIERGRTVVPLRLETEDAVFVVFRKAATTESRVLPVPTATPLTTVDGPWTVAFQPERGAPTSATFPTLTSWSDNSEKGIKYFAGTATYSKTLDAPSTWFVPGARLWLDLGEVKNIAEITLNGRALLTAWKAPFRVDVTGALRPGVNTLQISVTNLWANRLIGDAQPDADQKFTFTTSRFYGPGSTLMPSGLLGPVRIIRESER